MTERSRQGACRTSSPIRRLAIGLVVTVPLIALIVLYLQRPDVSVSVAPGGTEYIELDVPMQRFGRPKSFAKERGLPVSCTVTSARNITGGLHVSVIETGHSVHRLRARLRIHADSGVAYGTRRYVAEFVINGEGDWPTLDLAVTVEAE